MDWKQVDPYLSRFRRWAVGIMAGVLEDRPPYTAVAVGELMGRRVFILATVDRPRAHNDPDQAGPPYVGEPFQPAFVVLDEVLTRRLQGLGAYDGRWTKRPA